MASLPQNMAFPLKLVLLLLKLLLKHPSRNLGSAVPNEKSDEADIGRVIGVGGFKEVMLCSNILFLSQNDH